MPRKRKYKHALALLVAFFVAGVNSITRYLFAINEAGLREAHIIFLTAFFITLICWYINFRLLNFTSGTRLLRRSYANGIGIAISIIAAVLTGIVYAWLLSLLRINQSDSFSRYPTLQLLSVWGVLRCLLINTFIMVVKYTADAGDEKQEVLLKNEMLLNENLSARFEALKSQVSPHFLFNSLNTLNSLIKTQPQRAVDFVMRLSDVYRYLLQHNQQQVVKLKEELAFVKAYIFLIERRFEHNLHVHIAIPEPLLETYIPPVSLQILIENAVKHNIVTTARPLSVNISVTSNSIVVENNLQPKEFSGEATGTGLGSMANKYRLLTGSDIEVLTGPDKFTVLLPLIHSL